MGSDPKFEFFDKAIGFMEISVKSFKNFTKFHQVGSDPKFECLGKAISSWRFQLQI